MNSHNFFFKKVKKKKNRGIWVFNEITQIGSHCSINFNTFNKSAVINNSVQLRKEKPYWPAWPLYSFIYPLKYLHVWAQLDIAN